LADVVGRGEIEIFQRVNGQEMRARLGNEEIIRLLAEGRWAKSEPWCYRLTQRGGAAWEDWAKPQWSRYNTACNRDNLHTIGAATETVARQLLELEEFVLRECAIIQRSIRRRVFRNWRATYWKTLPEGHLIAFRTRPLPEEEWRPIPDAKWSRWVDLRQFYLHPTDCGF
jgi:hypothetical protein